MMLNTVYLTIDQDDLRHQIELVSALVDYPPVGYDEDDADHLEGVVRLLESVQRQTARVS